MGKHSAPRNRIARGTLIAALAAPAAVCLSWTPTGSAATVLGVEGTGQPTGTTQTAFNGAFCERNTCTSINNNRTPFDVALGSIQLQNAVAATQGDIIVMAYSLGAASTYHRLREWAENPFTAPDPARVTIVTFGNPENRFGGDDRNLFWTGLPNVQPYAHLEVAMQYDSVADRPTRWGWLSSVNATFARHLSYFDDVDINDPDNLVYRDGNTTYMLIKADVLPMLRWLDWFVDDDTIDQLDGFLRPLIERDYERPAFIEQGEGADWGTGTPPPSLGGPGVRSRPDGAEEPESARGGSKNSDGDSVAPEDSADPVPEELNVDEVLVEADIDPVTVLVDDDVESAGGLAGDIEAELESADPEPGLKAEPEPEPPTDTSEDDDGDTGDGGRESAAGAA